MSNRGWPIVPAPATKRDVVVERLSLLWRSTSWELDRGSRAASGPQHQSTAPTTVRVVVPATDAVDLMHPTGHG